MKIIAKNKKAYFDFEIIKTYEAGIVLVGSEIKSIRQGNINLKDSFAKVNYNGEIFLTNMFISKYKNAHIVENIEERRSRKLLLHNSEIKKLKSEMDLNRYTLVPTKIYFKRDLIKVELGLARGKKLHDKRQSLKEKDLKREMERAIKQKNY